MNRSQLACLSLVLALSGTASASAAELQITKGDGDPTIVYKAAAGESNHVVFDGDESNVGAHWSITDPGAPVPVPHGLPKGIKCRAGGAHRVACVGDAPRAITVKLGDGNDSETSTGDFAEDGPDITAQGGPGDDRLDGAGFDTLDGGPGSDVIRAGGNADTVIDTDTDRDDLRGGGGYGMDFLSFAGTSAPVVADLNTDTVASTGESMSGFEAVEGGDGNDRLTARSKGESNLIGNGGDDVLMGGDGHNVLDGGDGDDTITGGGHHDGIYPGTGTNTLSCGAASDTVYDPHVGDPLPADCEDVTWFFSRDPDTTEGLSLRPTRKGDGLRFAVGCPSDDDLDDGDPDPCSVPLTLQEAGGAQRLIGSGTITHGQHTTVPLTADGSALVTQGVQTNVTLRYENRTYGATFTLKA